MDEDYLSPDENDEEFKKMEKDIDDFLASIREDVTKTTEPESGASCSRVNNDYDCISSDDFEEKDFQLLNVKGHDLDFSSNSGGKSRGASSSRINKRGCRPWKWKRGVNKKRKGSRGEQHNIRGRRDRPKDSSNPWEEYEQYMKKLSSRKNRYNLKRSFHYREDDEYSRSSPRRRDEFDHERSLSPSGSTSYHRSVSPRERHEYGEWRNPSDGRNSRQEDRPYSRETHRSKRTMYHRIYDEGNYSPDSWSERQTNDYDYRDRRPNDQYWKHEDDPLMENDDDFQGSLSEPEDTVSVITACLERAIATNPEIAQKFSSACMFLLNKSVDRTCDDYEFEENSRGRFVDESGRVSPRSLRDSRSPSFSRSVGSSSGASGSRHYKNRYKGDDSRRIVVYHSSSGSEGNHSPDNRLKVRYSSGHDKQRTVTASTSQTSSTKERSSSKHHKNYHEENPRRTLHRSIRKIRKQCEEESDSTVRRALLALLEVHQRECDMYLRKPEAHPDYNKEYRAFVDKKSKSITDLGGDPNSFDFKMDWKRYWPTQINRVFKESWDAKMLKCASMLQRRGHVSKSLHASSEKDAINPPSKKKQKTSKHGSKKKPEEVKTTEKQKILQEASPEQCSSNKEEMDNELLSILRLLNHIKHKFQDCEASFDRFYQRAMSLKERKLDLCEILQGNLRLLEKIDASLKETLEDENLTLIQKAIIQETHERFKCFLRKSKETNSHPKKSNENILEESTKAVEVLYKEETICKDSKITENAVEAFVSSARIVSESISVHAERKRQIPCHVTGLHPSVITSEEDMSYAPCECCDSNTQVCRPVRTLTVVSIQETSCMASDAPNQTNHGNTSLSSLPSPMTQHGKFTCKSATLSVGKDTDNVGKDKDITQPPSPGVTPPPPGVTPPPPGVTPPPSGVTPPLCDVNPLPSNLNPHADVSPPSIGVTSPPDVTQAPCIVSPPVTGVTTPTTGVTLPPTANVTPTTTITSFQSVTSPPGTTHSSQGDKLSPSSSTSPVNNKAATADVTPSSPNIGSSPRRRPAVFIPQVSLSDSRSRVSNSLMSSTVASEALKPSSTISKPVEHNIKSIKDVIETISQTQTTHHSSQNLLRSTIKDCFLSTTSSDQGSVKTPIAKGLSTLDSKAEETTISSVPSLSEDILKMFVVKPEDKNEIEKNKAIAKISSSKSNTEIDLKPIEKKPIKITIPQFSKKKSMAEFKPIIDDQELQ